MTCPFREIRTYELIRTRGCRLPQAGAGPPRLAPSHNCHARESQRAAFLYLRMRAAPAFYAFLRGKASAAPARPTTRVALEAGAVAQQREVSALAGALTPVALHPRLGTGPSSAASQIYDGSDFTIDYSPTELGGESPMVIPFDSVTSRGANLGWVFTRYLSGTSPCCQFLKIKDGFALASFLGFPVAAS